MGRSNASNMGGLEADRTLSRHCMVCFTGPSKGRARPVPNTASITRAERAIISSSPLGDAMSMIRTPYSRARANLGSGSGRPPTTKQMTSAPQRRRCRAATSPSAPLLPGPTSTMIRTPAAPAMSRAPCATARPAFSIRVSVLTPALSDACSMAVICVAVTIFTVSLHVGPPRKPQRIHGSGRY